MAHMGLTCMSERHPILDMSFSNFEVICNDSIITKHYITDLMLQAMDVLCGL